MSEPGLAFVGRKQELSALSKAIDDAVSGHGSAWLLSGEPGIGKSRIAEEVARLAASRGAITLWGRSWEVGGAPAYWPWTQVLRSLLRGRDPASVRGLIGHDASAIAQVLPGLDIGDVEPLSVSEPEQARFRLFDAVARVLCDAAASTPLVLVLEDLHAADPSSVLLLDFLTRQLPATKLLLVGTFRDVEAERSAVAPLLARVAGSARAVALSRLSHDDVGSYLEQILAAVPPTSVVRAIHATTEGNPLFVVEVARLLVTRGGLERASLSVAVPQGVKYVIRERLGLLSAPALDALSAAAVVGREFSLATLSSILELSASALALLMNEAAAAAVLVETLPQSYRFGHALFRDVLYQDLEPERRRALHELAAAVLEGSGAGELPWGEIARHLRQAGGHPDRVRHALVRAAARAMDQLAFDDAVIAYEGALQELELRADASRRERCELLVALGRARSYAGFHDAGHRSCAEAAALARELGDARLLAAAALEYGSVFVFANVDEMLVALLREALEALGDEPADLVARVMGRLAAAMQPAAAPAVPIELGRRAIALARSVGDDCTLLATMKSACSALMDLGDPTERAELNREYFALARRLGEKGEALRGQMRLVFDCFELGDMTGVGAALEACSALTTELDQPHYSWRQRAFEAMHATWYGDFTAAERLNREAAELGEAARDPNASQCILLQRLALGDVSGGGADSAAVEVLRLGQGRAIEWFCRGYVAAYWARAGRLDAARATLLGSAVGRALQLGDRSLYAAFAAAVFVLRDTSLAKELRAVPPAGPERFVSGGMTAMYWGAPAGHALAQVAAVLDDWAFADAQFTAAFERLIRCGGLPRAAWVLVDHAETLLWQARKEPPVAASNRERARTLLEKALEITASLGMPKLREHAVELAREAAAGSCASDPRPARAEAPTEGPFTMRLDGEFWTFEYGPSTFRLRDSKGIRLLSRLVEAAGSELHALELMQPVNGPLDAGDAGEVIDAEAREQYRLRAKELQEELDEANGWNDAGRAERARAELRALTAELSRAWGLGGRERRVGSAAERARVNVQRRLRDALARIDRACPELGKHMELSVRTGAFCSYRPR
jgi:hypothetical protein